MTCPALGRPTWVTVDLNALQWNFRQVRKLVGSSISILAIVKANAYGHGAVACARALVAAGADALGVATVTEGVEIRRAGVRLPLVVLGFTQNCEAEQVLRWRLEPTIVSQSQARALSRAAGRAGRKIAGHLKIDTGMGRIGIRPHEVEEVIRGWNKLHGLKIQGVFTHFSHADGRDHNLLRKQIQGLQAAVRSVAQAGWKKLQVHAANSAAIIESPETYGNMVRPGLMLYGLYPAARLRRRVPLRPVLQWSTRIVQLKQVAAGTGLSYGHTYVTSRKSWIATLPVGYADGFSRGLSNRGRVLVRGRSCPVVGRVCMDMCLIDVTGIPGVKAGDEAVLIGRQGQKELTADDMANILNTISYEIVCAIGERVPRIYK